MNFIKDMGFLFINYFLNYIPSRKIRMIMYYLISNKRISYKSTIGIGVKILNIKNVYIEDYVNINYGSILDGRGAKIVISANTDIAPQVNIWTLQHDTESSSHMSQANSVYLGYGCWIGNRAIILPGSKLSKYTVIGAGSTFKGISDEQDIYVSGKNRLLTKKKAILETSFKLSGIRRFR